MGEWQFLLDENIDPDVVTSLNQEGIYGEHVRDVLGSGADDTEDILPYAREHDLIVVTSDVSDFGSLPADAHSGIVIVHDDAMPAYRVASKLIAMVEAYQQREHFGGRESLDSWS